MNQVFISIIIPTRNRSEELRQCLQALEPQVAAYNDVELIVCDDSSDSVTKSMLAQEFPQFSCHNGPQRGPGSNRNVGAKQAKGEWLIFVDDDCLPRPTLLSAYRAKMESFARGERVELEGATHRLPEKPNLLWEAPGNPNGGGMPSCNFAIPKWLYDESGGFDERFSFSFEDMEFAARLKSTGVVVHFVREAAVDHPLRPLPSARKLALRWESRVISSYDFGAKRRDILWLLPRHALLVILSRFRRQKLSIANLKAALIFAAEYFFFLQKLPSWCRRFQNSRSSFWSDPSHAASVPKRFGL